MMKCFVNQYNYMFTILSYSQNNSLSQKISHTYKKYLFTHNTIFELYQNLTHYLFLFNHLVVDGSWTQWSDWTICSLPCGGGDKTRSRSCSDPAPSNGGSTCPSVNSQSIQCNTQECSAGTCKQPNDA